MKVESHKKLQKIMNWITFAYVAVFIVVQLIVLVCTFSDLIEPEAFLAELDLMIFILMVFLNVFALVNYCRNAGNPYLNDKNKKYVRKFKGAVVAWNLAYIVKIVMSGTGVNLVDASKNKDHTADDFTYSLETFINIMFTEIVPFYWVLDVKIVKIFTMQFLEIP